MNNKFIIFVGIIILILTTITTIAWYIKIEPSASDMDVNVVGSLQINNSGINNHDEYLLNIKMIKNKDSHIIIYPYIDGLSNMNLSEKDGEKYYIPATIGSDGITESLAIQMLENKNIIEKSKDASLMGFWFPDEVGQYNSRIYLDKLNDFDEVKNPVLVCVYVEKKYGKELTWTKMVPVTIQ